MRRRTLVPGSVPNLPANITKLVGQRRKSEIVISTTSTPKPPLCTSANSRHVPTHQRERVTASSTWRRPTAGITFAQNIMAGTARRRPTELRPRLPALLLLARRLRALQHPLLAPNLRRSNPSLPTLRTHRFHLRILLPKQVAATSLFSLRIAHLRI